MAEWQIREVRYRLHSVVAVDVFFPLLVLFSGTAVFLAFFSFEFVSQATPCKETGPISISLFYSRIYTPVSLYFSWHSIPYPVGG